MVNTAIRDRIPLLGRLFGIFALVGLCVFTGHRWALRKVLPSVVTVMVVDTDLVFAARLDTGAEVSSINAIDLEVIGGEDRPSRRDIGREIRFTAINEAGSRARLAATIAGIHAIRTADCREYRYHVYLQVQHGDRRARILMNLNNRERATEKLLLGRNWLEHGYLVDASR